MRKQRTILVVDDEAAVREVVRKYLEREDFRVIEAETGPLALHLLHQEQPDLVVLDLMLPGLDGLTITRSLRDPAGGQFVSAERDIPIIMLTARGDELDRVTGFELGADDYVTKPFSPLELVVRIKAVLRRATGTAEQAEKPLVFANLSLDPASRTVRRSGVPVSLTAMEFDLLWFLASHARQVFSRAQLLDRVWGYQFYGDESTVTVHIHRLREKIEADISKPAYLHTVWGAGYKFEAPAE